MNYQLVNADATDLKRMMAVAAGSGLSFYYAYAAVATMAVAVAAVYLAVMEITAAVTGSSSFYFFPAAVAAVLSSKRKSGIGRRLHASFCYVKNASISKFTVIQKRKPT